MYSWQMRFSSSVETPGRTCSPIMSSTSAASRPATRILSCSSGVLTVIAMGWVRRLRQRAAFVAPSMLWYKARAVQAINDTHAPLTRQLGARGPGPERAQGRCGGAWRFNPTEGASDGRRHDASYAGSGRPFRTPDPLLEPEDGPVHLRRT